MEMNRRASSSVYGDGKPSLSVAATRGSSAYRARAGMSSGVQSRRRELGVAIRMGQCGTVGQGRG
jgi:hypothetical protein